MQQRFALVVPLLVLLAGCASMQSQSGCELASVPSDAVFGVREGVDTATWPSQIPRDLTGCQRVWYGDRQQPAAMRILATYHFDKGQVRRLVGQVPGGPSYDCNYRGGVLDTAGSSGAGLCPATAQVDQLPVKRP